MTRPWTLPGAECIRQELDAVKEKEKQMSGGRVPAVNDFETIKEALDRIKKEEEEAQKNAPKEEPGAPTGDYCCQLEDPPIIWTRDDDLGPEDFSCNGTSTDFYEGCGYNPCIETYFEYAKLVRLANKIRMLKLIDAFKLQPNLRYPDSSS